MPKTLSIEEAKQALIVEQVFVTDVIDGSAGEIMKTADRLADEYSPTFTTDWMALAMWLYAERRG